MQTAGPARPPACSHQLQPPPAAGPRLGSSPPASWRIPTASPRATCDALLRLPAWLAKPCIMLLAPPPLMQVGQFLICTNVGRDCHTAMIAAGRAFGTCWLSHLLTSLPDLTANMPRTAKIKCMCFGTFSSDQAQSNLTLYSSLSSCIAKMCA